MRPDDTDDADFAQDSFLDVVANVVGVLIILVMVIGTAASSGLLQQEEPSVVEQALSETQKVPSVDIEGLEQQLEQAVRRVTYDERELRNTVARIANIGYQSNHQDQLRLELAVHRAAVEEDLERRRGALSAEDQQKFDVQNKIFEAKLNLDELSNRQLNLLSDPGIVEEIKVEPTPVARKVDEDAVHLRLLGGAVCRVPFHELMEAAEYERDSIVRELSNNGGINRVVGPIGGFRLRLKTVKLPSGQAVTGPLVGSLGGRDRFLPVYYFQPVSEVLGEPLSQALLPDSNLRRALDVAKRQSSVVVAWVYSDSFNDYRSLRKMLADMGFAIAVYNLPVGAEISASPLGVEARAQ